MNQTMITLKQILGENNEFLNQFWNDTVADYSTLVSPNTHITKYGEFALKMITRMFKPYRDMYCIYSEDTGKDLLLEKIIEFIPELLTDTFTQSLMLNANMVDFDNIGKNTASNKSSVSYQGYDVRNQQGQFSNTALEAESSGGIQRLQYITFLNTYTTNKCSAFVRRVKSTLLQLIY